MTGENMPPLSRKDYYAGKLLSVTWVTDRLALNSLAELILEVNKKDPSKRDVCYMS